MQAVTTPRANFEVVQAYINVLLRVHADSFIAHPKLREQALQLRSLCVRVYVCLYVDVDVDVYINVLAYLCVPCV